MFFISELFGLIYPRVCPVCGRSLFRSEKIICLKCYHHLPRSHFNNDIDNPAARVFWGRVPLHRVHAAFIYNKGNAMQKLIHELKYRGRKDIGTFLGREVGKDISSISLFQDIDYIIPVPLHPRKKKKRGYNQSEIIASGIQDITDIPLRTDLLIRSEFSATQTRKSKYDRWKNVEHIFALTLPEELHSKHILLVDDVITTGSTMEACIQTLLSAENVKVSVAAAGYTGA